MNFKALEGDPFRPPAPVRPWESRDGARRRNAPPPSPNVPPQSLNVRAKSLDLRAKRLDLRAKSLVVRAKSSDVRVKRLNVRAKSSDFRAKSLDLQAKRLNVRAKRLKLPPLRLNGGAQDPFFPRSGRFVEPPAGENVQFTGENVQSAPRLENICKL
jgi:hypothetical protein